MAGALLHHRLSHRGAQITLGGWALARVPPSTVAVYVYLQPLFAFAVAPIILGESLNLHTVIASLLIFMGVLVVTRRRTRAPVDVAI